MRFCPESKVFLPGNYYFAAWKQTFRRSAETCASVGGNPSADRRKGVRRMSERQFFAGFGLMDRQLRDKNPAETG